MTHLPAWEWNMDQTNLDITAAEASQQWCIVSIFHQLPKHHCMVTGNTFSSSLFFIDIASALWIMPAVFFLTAWSKSVFCIICILVCALVSFLLSQDELLVSTAHFSWVNWEEMQKKAKFLSPRFSRDRYWKASRRHVLSTFARIRGLN